MPQKMDRARVCECIAKTRAFYETKAMGCALPNLLLMELSSDPNTDRAVEVWKRSRERLAPVIPVLRLTRPEIGANMELLKSRKTVVWYDASCMEDARDMCALFARELPVR